MDKKKIVNYDESDDYQYNDSKTGSKTGSNIGSKTGSHSSQSSQISNKTKSDPNFDKIRQKSNDEKDLSQKNRDLSSDKGYKYETKSGHKTNYDRNERYDNRRHYERSNDRSKRREHSSYDQRDRYNRHSRKRRDSRSRSRSRSRERYSQSSNSRRDKISESRAKHEPQSEKMCLETKNPNNKPHINTLLLMREQIKAKTGVEFPKYYNVGAINPIKYAEQEQKRKLLWSRDETKKSDKKSDKQDNKEVSTSTASPWNNLKFEGDKGNQMTEKFRKLMGIKDKCCVASNMINEEVKKNENVIESQETLFRNLDMQYSIARSQSHTHRGVGLGFQSSTTSGTTTVEHN